MALRVLSKAIPRPDQGRVRLLTIFFGANDSCFPTETNNQCVPLPEFRSNLIKIIKSPMVSEHNPKIILITNPPVDERTQYAMDLAKGYPMRRTAENTAQYAAAIRSVGESLNLPVCDIWTDIMLKAGWRPGSTEFPGCTELPPNPVLHEYLFDGLHLSPLGYELLFSKIMECISTVYPEEHPDALPYVLPRWDDGDAWRLRGETGEIVTHRPRAPVKSNVGETLTEIDGSVKGKM